MHTKRPDLENVKETRRERKKRQRILDSSPISSSSSQTSFHNRFIDDRNEEDLETEGKTNMLLSLMGNLK